MATHVPNNKTTNSTGLQPYKTERHNQGTASTKTTEALGGGGAAPLAPDRQCTPAMQLSGRAGWRQPNTS